jgi:glutathione reductase (NADPH)
MVTSDDMLSESKRPESIVFIGGGVISLEFGHVYARAGSSVTILEALPQLLPAMDADAVARLQAESERIGLQISTGVRIERIEATGGRFRVIFTHEGTEKAAEADWVVNGAGRIADVESLGLAAGQVDHDNGRIAIDSYLRSTSNSRVYVCGDAVPTSPQLSPIATYEGDLAGRNIVDGPKHSPDYASIATAVYTVPALAAVGLTEAAVKAKGLAAEVHINDMHDWFSARTYAETVAWSKIIVDRSSDCILGAHFVGHAGHELVNIFGLAMKFGIRARELREHIYAYPTFASDMKHMLGLRCIARRYRLNSQPAFPKAEGLRDADDTAGQLLEAATSSKEITTCSVTS